MTTNTDRFTLTVIRARFAVTQPASSNTPAATNDASSVESRLKAAANSIAATP